MDSRELVVMVKRYAVDDIVESFVGTLKSPRSGLPDAANPSANDTLRFVDKHSVVHQRRSAWYGRLTPDDRAMIGELLEDCAEAAVANVFTLLDGVGGSYEGVFEIVAVDSASQRHVLNPGNSPMLHDLFSEVCEEGRR